MDMTLDKSSESNPKVCTIDLSAANQDSNHDETSQSKSG